MSSDSSEGGDEHPVVERDPQPERDHGYHDDGPGWDLELGSEVAIHF